MTILKTKNITENFGKSSNSLPAEYMFAKIRKDVFTFIPSSLLPIKRDISSEWRIICDGRRK